MSYITLTNFGRIQSQILSPLTLIRALIFESRIFWFLLPPPQRTTKIFQPSVSARSVFVDTSILLIIWLLSILHHHTTISDCAYGLQTGLMDDSHLSSTSMLSSNYATPYGRLRNRTSAWCPRRYGRYMPITITFHGSRDH